MPPRRPTVRVAVPAPGKGHTFESCRVRHFFLFYSAICTPGLKLQLCLIRASKQSGGKSSPNADSLATRLALKAVVRVEAVPRRRDENPRVGCPPVRPDE